MIAHGTKILVAFFGEDIPKEAVVAGSYLREHDQLDATGRFVIAHKGWVYQVRFKPEGGLYNVHESRVVVA